MTPAKSPFCRLPQPKAMRGIASHLNEVEEEALLLRLKVSEAMVPVVCDPSPYGKMYAQVSGWTHNVESKVQVQDVLLHETFL